MTATAKIFVAGHEGMAGSALVRRLIVDDKPIVAVDPQYYRPTEVETLRQVDYHLFKQTINKFGKQYFESQFT